MHVDHHHRTFHAYQFDSVKIHCANAIALGTRVCMYKHYSNRIGNYVIDYKAANETIFDSKKVNNILVQIEMELFSQSYDIYLESLIIKR